MSLAKNQATCFNLEHIGWKSYNSIKKKAMEQEFSWSGLLISLSIAFFVVTVSALCLNFIFNSVKTNKQHQELANKINYSENANQVNLSIN